MQEGFLFLLDDKDAEVPRCQNLTHLDLQAYNVAPQ